MVILNEKRNGRKVSHTRNAGPIEALAILFEDDLWWTADIVDCSPTRLVVRVPLHSDCANTMTFEGSEEEIRTLGLIVSRALTSVLRFMRQPPWSTRPSASATLTRHS